jgi:LCP family protein required for cell wall assembly
MTHRENPMADSPRSTRPDADEPHGTRSPSVAAALSFLVPGLGQGWAGARRRGVLVAVPFIAFIALVLVALVSSPDRGSFVGLMLQPTVLLGFFALNLVLLLYRSWAILDADRVARGINGRLTPRSGVATVVLAVLLLFTVGLHGVVAYVDWNGYDAIGLFPGDAPGGNGPNYGDGIADTAADLEAAADEPVESPGASAALSELAASMDPATASDDLTSSSSPSPSTSASSSPSPTPTPGTPYWATDGRLNVLLIGGDAGPGRVGLRTDSMTLLTVDLKTARAALFGFPRNLQNVPLPPKYQSLYKCRCFPDLLNALYRYAQSRPDVFPGNGVTRGYRALSDTIGYLANVKIDGVVSIDLNGFVKVVDSLGGLWINVPYRIYDRAYPKEDGSGTKVLIINPGYQRLNGSMALAFARTRHQDSDYGRMQRQQLTLLAIRKQLNPCSMLPRLSQLVKIAKESLWTNVPVSQLPGLIALADRVDTGRISKRTFVPPTINEHITASDVTKIRKAIRDAFKGAAPLPDETPPPNGLFGC